MYLIKCIIVNKWFLELYIKSNSQIIKSYVLKNKYLIIFKKHYGLCIFCKFYTIIYV